MPQQWLQYLPFLIQSAAIVWWASGVNAKVEATVNLPSQNLQIIERLSRVEARVDDVKDQITRIANILDTKHNVIYKEISHEKDL